MASVRPAFGNIKAHQFNVYDIRRIPVNTARVEIQKNQNEKRKMKLPEMTPMTRRTSPVSNVEGEPMASFGTTLDAKDPKDIKAADV